MMKSTETMSLDEAEKLWGISIEILKSLCVSNEIEGATITGDTWILPRNATKPVPKWLRIKCDSEVLLAIKNLKNIRVLPGKHFYWIFWFHDILDKKMAKKFSEMVTIKDESGVSLVCLAESNFTSNSMVVKVKPVDGYKQNISYSLHYPVLKKIAKKTSIWGTLLKHTPVFSIECWFLKIIAYIANINADLESNKSLVYSYLHKRYRTVRFTLEDNLVNNVVIKQGYTHDATLVTKIEPVIKTVKPKEELRLGYIIVESNIGAIEVKMRHFEKNNESHFPDMVIIAPNGDDFGFGCKHMNSRKTCHSEKLSSCKSSTYSGYMNRIEEMRFENPMEGKWSLVVRNIGNNNDTVIEFSCNLPIQPYDKDDVDCEFSFS